jgi:hypothetical protein
MNGDGEDQSSDSTVMPSGWAPRALPVDQVPPAPAPGVPGAGEDQSTDSTVIPSQVLWAQPVYKPAPPPDPTQFGALANTRGAFVKELASNPDLWRKLMVITDAEVGTDNDAAKQAFIESVMNRAVARGMSLDDTLSSVHIPGTDIGYWDPKTGAHSNDPVPPAVSR